MAAFSSNIDITSGGTYAMDVTNGETSAKVATDLNGKFANIQELLQNGLPEVWTGDSLPDSLPNGKLLYYNNNLYLSNLLRVLDTNDLNTINNNVQEQISSSIIYTRSTDVSPTFNIGANIKGVVCQTVFKGPADIIYMPTFNNNTIYITTTSGGKYSSLRPAILMTIGYTMTSSSLKINRFYFVDDEMEYTGINYTSCIFFT